MPTIPPAENSRTVDLPLPHGVSRRAFLGFCSAVTAALALPEAMTPRIAHAVASAPRLPVVWLATQDCTADTESFLRSVDPGVGSDRRAVAVEVGSGESVLVGPDNGLLAAAVGMVGGADRVVELTNPDYHLPSPGATFAGRDIFAPVAAHLCAGVALEDLGTRIEPSSLQPGMIPLPFADGGGPAQGREKGGPTCAILSTTSWDHSALIGGLAGRSEEGLELADELGLVLLVLAVAKRHSIAQQGLHLLRTAIG